jgi:plastocyanin
VEGIPDRISLSIVAGAIAIGMFATTMACGGSPTGPGGDGQEIVASTGRPGTSGATITLTSAGITTSGGGLGGPSSVTIVVNQSVTFVNNDTRPHEIASDPHPQHGSCPSIERGLGTILPGQTKVTQGFAGVGTCTFHDHLDDSNPAFKGSIRIMIPVD